MKYAVILSVLLLAGCATTKPQEPIVITKTETITRLPPASLLELPPKVEPIDARTATQADAARYLIDLYNRMVKLENQLIGISQFFRDPPKEPQK